MENLWEKYAKVLVDYSVKVQKGELTIIRTDSYQSQPLVKEIYKQVLKKGAYPVVRMGVEGLNEVYIKNASDEIITLIGYVGEQLETNESKLITASIDKEITDASQVEYTINH